MREKRIFIGLSDRFAKPLSSEGFARVDFSGDNHRGGSRSPDHCGDYCSTQKSVHNLGYMEPEGIRGRKRRPALLAVPVGNPVEVERDSGLKLNSIPL